MKKDSGAFASSQVPEQPFGTHATPRSTMRVDGARLVLEARERAAAAHRAGRDRATLPVLSGGGRAVASTLYVGASADFGVLPRQEANILGFCATDEGEAAKPALRRLGGLESLHDLVALLGPDRVVVVADALSKERLAALAATLAEVGADLVVGEDVVGSPPTAA